MEGAFRVPSPAGHTQGAHKEKTRFINFREIFRGVRFGSSTRWEAGDIFFRLIPLLRMVMVVREPTGDF
jgi:hypothetical protein